MTGNYNPAFLRFYFVLKLFSILYLFFYAMPFVFSLFLNNNYVI